MPIETLMMGCESAACDFKPMKLERRDVGDFDVLIDMKYCGICHSDLSFAAGHMNGLGSCKYPCVPGHELSGIVSKVGSKVTKVKVGDKAGVGCLVDSCQNCKNCKAGEEQYCSNGSVATYNSRDKHGRAHNPIGWTLGGYTKIMVCDENFVIRIPETYPLEYAGPVMCSGITMYDPMRRYGLEPGQTVGIVGLGGLGVMGIKIAKALGAKVVAISRSNKKEKLALEAGADEFLVSSSKAEMKAAKRSMNMILNTAPVYHDYTIFLPLLKRGSASKLVLLGLHKGLGGATVASMLTCGRSKVVGSQIGGIEATQEIIDICATNNIKPNIEMCRAEDVNEVFEKLEKSNDAGVRYVMDIENTLNEETESKCTHPPPALSENFTGGLSVKASLKEGLWLFFTGRW